MKIYNRSQREIKNPLPARLQRLNRELMTERTKMFDDVYAVGNGLRIRVHIMRNEDGNFAATAQLGSRVFRADVFTSPAAAYVLLAVRLKTTYARMPSAEKDQVKIQMRLENQ